MAAAYLLDDRLDQAITHGELGRAESQRIGDEEATLNAAATVGTVLVRTGRMDEGWQLLEDTIARACGTQQEAEAARGYRLIGSAASELVEYGRGQRWLADGIRYAEQAELWNHRHFMASHLGHVQWATGRWDAATQTAQQALADGRGGITTRITAQYVLGFLAMGRADWEAADTLLREALVQGEQLAELNRLSPPLWGLAEAARCQGDYGTAVTLCERGYAADRTVVSADRTRIRGRPAHRDRPHQPADRRPASARAQDHFGPRHAHSHQAGRRTPRRDRGVVRDCPTRRSR